MLFLLNLKRFKFLSTLLLLSFCTLTARLAYINIARGEELTAQVQRQRLLSIPERLYDRGSFQDRHGVSLTDRPEQVLAVFPSLLPDKENPDYWPDYFAGLLADSSLTPYPQSASLSQLLAKSTPFILARLGDNADLSASLPASGVYQLVLRPRYTAGNPAAHILGYVGAATNAEAVRLKDSSPYIGKTGLEKQYDALLRGQPSDRIAVAVDEKGQPAAGGLHRLAAAPHPGLNIRLTLDYNYQLIAEAAMADKNGALVLMEVKTGDVLAMVSAPGYTQELGQPAAEGDVYINKALSYYPPASVFKIVLALAALDNGVSIDPAASPTNTAAEPFCCTGSVTLENGHTVSCWQTAGHGPEELATALGNSCNPYFIQLGQKLGGQLIAEYAWRLGMCRQTLQGLEVDSASQLNFNYKVAADVANVSIGERGIRVTPLMQARLLAAVANDGRLPTPRLVQALVDDSGRIIQEFPASAPQQVVKPESARTVRRYLAQAVREGTGKPAASSLITIAGKTGTTQNFGVWFAGFFPADEPRWSIAVYIADGQSGGSDAGSVCREVAEKIALLENITNQSRV